MLSAARHKVRLTCALFGSMLAACGGSESTSGPVEPTEPSYICESLQAPTACPDPAPTFAQVAPIFGERCATPCHSGTPNGPWPLSRYEHIFDWQEDIRSHLLDCTMPPLDGGVAITTEERVVILNWIRCGLPE
jgi:hypothetical protein